MNFNPRLPRFFRSSALFFVFHALLLSMVPGHAGTLSVSNGSFSDLSGNSVTGGGWYGGVPTGWSTTASWNGYSVYNASGTHWANLQTLGPTSPSFSPLRQTVGTVNVTSDIRLTFSQTLLAGGSSLYSAIYNQGSGALLGIHGSGAISGEGSVTYSVRGVDAGTTAYIAFWNGSGAAGLSGVSISDSATTYAWDGGVSGVWTNGGGGWTDKFDNTATTYNNAKPVVVQFTNSSGGNVTVASGGVTTGDLEVTGTGYQFSGDQISVVSGSKLDLASGGLNRMGNAITGAGSVLQTSGETRFTGDVTLSGGMTLAGGTVRLGDNGNTGSFSGNTVLNNSAQLVFDRANAYTHEGLISGTGTVAKVSAGTTTLTASNSYSGGTTLYTGTLVASNAHALGTGNISFSSAGGNTGTIQYTTNSAGTDWGSRLKNSTGAIRLDTDGNNVNLAGAIDNSNTQGLVKSGTGRLTLSGSNSYTGVTVVNAGALQVASGGSISSSSAIVNSGGTLDVEGTAGSVTINSGGRIEGGGSVGALTIASGGVLAPGNSPGTLTASSANWNAGGIYSWDLGSALGNDSSFLTGQGANWDFLNVSGILDIGAAAGGSEFIINIVDLLATYNGTFDAGANYSFAIATAAGGITNFLSSDFSFTGFLANSNKWSVGVVGNGGSSESLVLSYTGATAIPEPSTGILFLSSLGILALRRRSKAN